MLDVREGAGRGFIPTRVGNIHFSEALSCLPAVHPHTCGEHAGPMQARSIHTGSSPHVWGTSAGSASCTASARFIPTRVGNIGTRTRHTLFSAVHPHTCGEHKPFTNGGVADPGSSPHVWGTSVFVPADRLLDRFIPTRVGNIAAGGSGRGELPVHPHTCGEHTTLASGRYGKNGSSPHVWGTFCLPDEHPPVRAVHPHTCGEHRTRLKALTMMGGSSPHVWGTFHRERAARLDSRFIPTRVGNITSHLGAIRGNSVHPHTCGEHASPFLIVSNHSGSSPHVWGTFLVE